MVAAIPGGSSDGITSVIPEAKPSGKAAALPEIKKWWLAGVMPAGYSSNMSGGIPVCPGRSCQGMKTGRSTGHWGG